jgi:hypothetical protein
VETKSKVQRLRAWLCRLLCAPPTQSREPAVFRIVGTNRERFSHDGYDVELEVFTDRIIYSVYLKGHRILKGWVFHSSDNTFILDNAIRFHPDYKLRQYLRDYAVKRLTELADNNSKDL